MSSKRAELAFSQLTSERWRRFEKFAGSFLVEEFPAIRPMANPGGDNGRDAELFVPDGDPHVVLQFSTEKDWKGKLRKTAQRLRETKNKAHVLVYCTSIQIGATSDEVKKEMRSSYQLTLDIRDAQYFLDREHLTVTSEKLFRELERELVDPLLEGIETKLHPGIQLSKEEQKAAVIFLGLQYIDDTKDKSLTRICFESLVRLALKKTSAESRINRNSIHEFIHQILPKHDREIIKTFVDAALLRLVKRTIRHWTKEDEFCVTQDEKLLEMERVAGLQLQENVLRKGISDKIAAASPSILGEAILTSCTDISRKIIDDFLWHRGEAFVMATQAEDVQTFAVSEINSSISHYAASFPKIKGIDVHALIKNVIISTLQSPSKELSCYISQQANAYTLLAFLRQTPDVQSATKKLLGASDLWLDTSFLLPVMSESLIEDEGVGRLTAVLIAARECGMRIHATPGVIEELSRHIAICNQCVRSLASWRGNVPFLLSMYLSSGRSIDSFGEWIAEFCGSVRPEIDLSEYLMETYSIETISLTDYIVKSGFSTHEIYQISEKWRIKHETRRGPECDKAVIARLTSHDIECYFGVIGKRKAENPSDSGFRTWWLTLDGMAFGMNDYIKDNFHSNRSPIMGIDFLINYLSLSTNRSLVSTESGQRFPTIFSPDMGNLIPIEFIEIANQTRAKMVGKSERIIRRTIRDHLDQAKARLGALANGGMRAAEEIVKAQLEALK